MHFPMEEYRYRINRTKQKMQERGIEVLLITNPSNMYYLTGYNVWSFYVQQMVVIFIDEQDPYWIGREMDANSAKSTTWLPENHIVHYSDEYVQSIYQHPMHFVADFLRGKSKTDRKTTIGIEKESHFFSAENYEQLKKSLPNANFQDASIEVGVRQCDAVSEITRVQTAGTPEYGGDYPAIVPMLPTGKKANAPHLTWSDKIYEKDEPVILELSGCHKRYHSPMARTMFLGTPPQKLKDLHAALLEGLNQVIETIEPTMTSEQVAGLFQKVIGSRGYHKRSRIGYSVGASYPPDWGEHTVSFREGDKTVIEPNMVFHIIPGIWYDDFGCALSETIRITENGCETLADFPRELYIKN